MEDTDDLGFGVEGPIERTARPYLNALAALRDLVRAAAQKKESPEEALSLHQLPAAPDSPYAQALAAFREQVRVLVQQGADNIAILKACDQVRDEILPQIGVSLEDRTGKPARWRLDDPSVLLEEIEERRKAAAEKAAGKGAVDPKKLKQRITMKTKDLDKFAKGLVPLTELFKQGEHAGKFTAFDEAGMPTTDATGEPIGKGPLKKLTKGSILPPVYPYFTPSLPPVYPQFTPSLPPFYPYFALVRL